MKKKRDPHVSALNARWSSVDHVLSDLRTTSYIADHRTVMAVYLAALLEKPLLVEGPAGVGKTALARCLAQVLPCELIRLQCYEGLDESKALFEWAYHKQILSIQLSKEAQAQKTRARKAPTKASTLDSAMRGLFTEEFLVERPLLAALRRPHQTLLLIDEIDRADPEFEAMLLEVLSEFQITIPQLGTVQARHKPLFILTSNGSRELSDALRRRCIYTYLDYPTPSRELEILRSHLPQLTETFGQHLAELAQHLRQLDLEKKPSVSEVVEWTRAMLLLGAENLDLHLLRSTLGVIAKHESDSAKVEDALEALHAWIGDKRTQ